MELNKGILNALKRFLQSNQQSVKINSRLAQFIVEQGYSDFGTIQAFKHEISFSATQKIRLKNQFEIDHGNRLLSSNLKGSSYLSTAKISRNEKLADVKPDQYYALLTCSSGNFTPFLMDQAHNVFLPRGGSLRCHIEKLNFSQINQVIVIENLTAFDYINLIDFPIDVDQALIVYRGHDKMAIGCKALLSKLVKGCQVIGFFDYDPKGLELATSIPNATHFIYPELIKTNNPEQLIETALHINHQADFLKQYSSVNNLKSKLLRESKPDYQIDLNILKYHLSFLQSNKLSIKQEHMIVHKLPLALACIKGR